jgi:hypothetical protein
VEVDPGQYTIVDMFYYTCRYEVSYNATVILKGKSGSTYQFARAGNMNGTTSGVATFTQRHLEPNDVNGLPESLGPVEETLEKGDVPLNTKEPISGSE